MTEGPFKSRCRLRLMSPTWSVSVDDVCPSASDPFTGFRDEVGGTTGESGPSSLRDSSTDGSLVGCGDSRRGVEEEGV